MESSTTLQPEINFIAPIAQKDRIHFLDCIRGMALLGILIMNITAQGQAHQLYDIMDVRLPLTGYNFYAWAIESFVFVIEVSSILFVFVKFIILYTLHVHLKVTSLQL